jgi:hypothetical protein
MYGYKIFFFWKATKSKYLILYFSFPYSSLFNLSKWLSISKQTWWKTFNHPTSFIITIVSLISLCGKSVKQSQIPRETDDSNRISYRNLNTRHVVTHRVTSATFPFIPVSWIRATVLEYKRSTNHGRRRAMAALALTIRPMRIVSRRWNLSTHQFNRILKLTDYHIFSMWLVRSNA